MRTEFEAFLTKCEKDSYHLYIDIFDANLLYETIGHENILSIIMTYIGYDCQDKTITLYDTTEPLKSIYEYVNNTIHFDMVKSIVINDVINISFSYWGDAHVVANWNDIIRIIEGQKLGKVGDERKVLDILPVNLDTYYFVKNRQLVIQKSFSVDQLYKLLSDEFERKTNEFYMNVVEQDEWQDWYVSDLELKQEIMENKKKTLEFDAKSITGTSNLNVLAKLLISDSKNFTNYLSCPKFQKKEKEIEFMDMVNNIVSFGSDEDKIELLKKYGKNK